MRVLLLGASGFVGSAILEELAKNYHQIQLRALLRPRKEPRGLYSEIETIPGDILNARDVEEAVRDCDVIINSVGIIAQRGENTYENIHVKAVKYTVEAGKKFFLKKYVLVSALGTREDAPSIYHRTKFQGEELVRTSGNGFTIFRPSVIFGKKDRFVNLLARLVYRLPIVPVLGNGENKFQPIYVGDLARFVCISATSDVGRNEVVKVGGARIYTYNEILLLIAKLLQRQTKPLFHIPLGLMKIPSSLLKVPVNYEQWQMLHEDNALTSEEYRRLIELFGYEPSSLEEKLPEYIFDVIKGKRVSIGN